jgi:hypothetical protein
MNEAMNEVIHLIIHLFNNLNLIISLPITKIKIIKILKTQTFF